MSETGVTGNVPSDCGIVGLWDPDLPHSLLLPAHAVSGFALSRDPIKYHLATNSKTERLLCGLTSGPPGSSLSN